MEEAVATSSRESAIQSKLENAGFAIADMGTQTDIEVLCDSKSIQTCPPPTCYIGVQTDDCHFLMRKLIK